MLSPHPARKLTGAQPEHDLAGRFGLRESTGRTPARKQAGVSGMDVDAIKASRIDAVIKGMVVTPQRRRPFTTTKSTATGQVKPRRG